MKYGFNLCPHGFVTVAVLCCCLHSVTLVFLGLPLLHSVTSCSCLFLCVSLFLSFFLSSSTNLCFFAVFHLECLPLVRLLLLQSFPSCHDHHPTPQSSSTMLCTCLVQRSSPLPTVGQLDSGSSHALRVLYSHRSVPLLAVWPIQPSVRSAMYTSRDQYPLAVASLSSSSSPSFL